MHTRNIELVITCRSWQEAQRIADALLEMQLVESVETFEIKPTHWWESHQHGTREVKLVVLATVERMNQIQKQASKLRSIKTDKIELAELIKS